MSDREYAWYIADVGKNCGPDSGTMSPLIQSLTTFVVRVAGGSSFSISRYRKMASSGIF